MSSDIDCSIIVVSCAVLHNIALQWKQPLLEDEVFDDSYTDDVIDFEETDGNLASKHYKDKFLSIISTTKLSSICCDINMHTFPQLVIVR